MVKIGTTQAQRKLFYNLNKERQRLQNLGFDPSASQLSEALNVTEADIVEMDQRLGGNDLSLDVSLGEDSSSTRLDFLPALTPGIEEMLAGDEISKQLEKHIQSIRPTLNEKEIDLLDNRMRASPLRPPLSPFSPQPVTRSRTWAPRIPPAWTIRITPRPFATKCSPRPVPSASSSAAPALA